MSFTKYNTLYMINISIMRNYVNNKTVSHSATA